MIQNWNSDQIKIFLLKFSKNFNKIFEFTKFLRTTQMIMVGHTGPAVRQFDSPDELWIFLIKLSILLSQFEAF